MGEKEILDDLYKDLRLDNWWKELLGQEAVFDGFDPYKAMETLPRTEQTSAEEIARKFKNILSFTEKQGIWYIWDGRIHTPCDGDGISIKITKLYYRTMCRALDFIKEAINKEADKMKASNVTDASKKAGEIRAIYEKGEFSKHRSYRDRISSDAGQSALARTLRTEVDVSYEYFDNDQRWFVMRNCVLDLDALKNREWSFLPHSPSRPVTKYFDADYDYEANLGHWDAFLKTSIPNENTRNYLQEIAGAAFMGSAKLKCIPNLYGPPDSGKSVFINTMFKLGKEGAGYAAMPDSKAIVKVSGQNFEQDEFKGRRFIGISEPSQTDKVDDDFLKRFTGDVWVETRTLNVKSSGWIPQGVVFVASNTPLRINTREKAIVERVQIIEFPIQFESGPGIPEGRRMVEGLEDNIMADKSRILSWILEGMVKFIKNGQKLHPPEEVLTKRDEVVSDASTALRWVADYIDEELLIIDYTVDTQYCIPVKDAYMRYQMWATLSGEKKPLTLRFFTQDVETKYGDKVKSGVARFPGLVMTDQYRSKFETNAIPGMEQRF